MVLVRFWRRLRISYKLGLTLGALSLLIFIVAGLGDITLRGVIARDTEIINVNFEIERLVLKMVNHLQTARESEFAFYLFYPEIGYDEAYDLYALDVLSELDAAIALSEQLSNAIEGTVTQQEQESTINLFLTLAEQYEISYSVTLAHIDTLTDVEVRLNAARTNLGLYTNSQLVLGDMYEELVEFQQTYFRNKNREAMQAAIQEADKLADTAPIFFGSSDSARDQIVLEGIQRGVETYRQLALEVIVLNNRISTQIERVNLQASSITPASEQLLNFAREQTQQAQTQTQRTQRFTTLALLIASFISLGLVLLIGRLLNGSITRNLEILSRAVSSLRAGNLTARVNVAAEDEIGVLASGFNSMADQLSHLVGNLEERVAERTSELVEASDEIQRLNARLQEENLRMESELDISSRIQRMVLPSSYEMSQIDNLEIASYMTPVTEVGGDYYDVLQHDGKVKIGIGDVTGHGLESGILSLMVQTAVRTLMTSEQTNPIQFMTTLNRTIYDNLERMDIDKSLTLSIVDYEACAGYGEVRLSGQHEYFIVVRNSGQVEVHDTIDLGFPIGLEADISTFVDELRVPLHTGDGVVLYTDGITEAEDTQGRQYGLERLCALLSRSWHEPVGNVCQHVVDDVYSYIGNAQVYDDFTLVVMKQR
ncbi:MAG: SpoIIE family protein phosphatase [Deinococcota bacterium]